MTYMDDELFERRLAKHLDDLEDRLEAEIERQAGEHPLDTLLRMMLENRWPEDDAMVVLVRRAMRMPYPGV